MRGTTFIFLMVLLAILSLPIYGASQGNVIALVTLAILLTIFLIATGAGIALIVVRAMAKREERNFQNNMAENLAMMRQYQTLLTAQNLEVMRQVKALPKPAQIVDMPALEIPEEVFTDLEN